MSFPKNRRRRRKAKLQRRLLLEPLEARIVFTDVGGALSGNHEWCETDDAYRVVSPVTVRPGASLTICSGVRVETTSGARISVRGQLTADGVQFSGATSIQVYGQMNLSGSDVAGKDIYFRPSSTGSIVGNTFDVTQVQLFGADLAVSGNTFRGADPLHVGPSLVPSLAGSSFEGAETTTVYVRDWTQRETQTDWHPLPGVDRLVVNGHLGVNSGSSLTIHPGVEIVMGQSALFEIRGAVEASEARFAGTTNIQVYGSLDLTDSDLSGRELHFRPSSHGQLTGNTFELERLQLFGDEFSINDNTIQGNDVVHISPSLVSELEGNAIEPGEGESSVFIRDWTLPGSRTSWKPVTGVDRFVIQGHAGIRHDSEVSLSPGTVVVFASGSRLEVRGGLAADQVEILGESNIQVYGALTLTDTTVMGNEVHLRASSVGQLSGSLIDVNRLQLFGVQLGLTDNEFHGSHVIHIGPSLVPELRNNRFISEEPTTVTVRDWTANGSQTHWEPLPGVDRLLIEGHAGVRAGSTLVIGPGLHVAASAGSRLEIRGDVAADGLHLSGSAAIQVYGSLDLANSTLAGKEIRYRASSRGTILNNDFHLERLELFGEPLSVHGNHIFGTAVVHAAPSIVPELHGNAFSGDGETTLFIRDWTATGRETVWEPLPGIQRFVLEGHTGVRTGSSLTIRPGVKVHTLAPGELEVRGDLTMDQVEWLGQTRIEAFQNSSLQIARSEIDGNLLAFRTGSSGQISDSRIEADRTQLLQTAISLEGAELVQDIEILNGVVSVRGDHHLATLSHDGGTLNVTDGTMSVDELRWSSGVLTGDGSTRTTEVGWVGGRGTRHLDNHTLQNEGHLKIAGDLRLSTGSALIVDNEATLDFTADASLRRDSNEEPLPVLRSDGLVVKSGGDGVTRFETTFANYGTVDVQIGRLTLDGGLSVAGDHSLKTRPGAALSLSGNLSAESRDADGFQVHGVTRFSAAEPAEVFSELEVMSENRGTEARATERNFNFGTLEVATRLRLVDRYDNAANAEPEVLYVNQLVVPEDGILDLNGVPVYARSTEVQGTIIGDSLEILPDGGALLWNTPMPGTLSLAGEKDGWTFFGRFGEAVSVLAHTGSESDFPPPNPALDFARLELRRDDTGELIAWSENSKPGGAAAVLGVPLPSDGLYRVDIAAATDHAGATGGYLVDLRDASVDFQSLEINRRHLGRIESDHAVDRWTFAAQKADHVRLERLGNGGEGIAFRLLDPAGAIVFTGLIQDSELISLRHNGTYTLEAYSQDGRLGEYAFRLAKPEVIALSSRTPYVGQLASSDHGQLFSIDMDSPTTLLVSLTDQTEANRSELYVRFGAPPTRAEYDYRSGGRGPEPSIVVPQASAGRWYVLLYGDYVPEVSTYELEAIAADVTLTDVSVTKWEPGMEASVVLRGAGFDPRTDVELLTEDGTRVALPSSVALDSFTQLTATFPAGAIPAGVAYELRVRQGQSSDSKPGPLLNDSPADLETQIILPKFLGYHQLDTIYVEYSNTGGRPMAAPMLAFTAEQNGRQSAIMTLQHHRLSRGFWTETMPQGFSNTVLFLANGRTPGVLQPGETVRVPIYWAGWQKPWDGSNPPFKFGIGVVGTDDDRPVDWQQMKNSLRPESMPRDAWHHVWDNFVRQAGTTWGDYVDLLSRTAQYLGTIGEQTVDIEQLTRFAMVQSDGVAPLNHLSRSTDYLLQQRGLPLELRRTFAGVSISRRFSEGDFGRGWTHNWNWHIETHDSGDVTVVEPSGWRRTFQPDLRNDGFVSPSADAAKLIPQTDDTYSLREPNGLERRFLKDGRLDFVADLNGNRITASYQNDHLAGLTHSSGAVLTMEYDENGRMKRVVDHLSRATTYSYSSRGDHLEQVASYDGSVVTYTYSSRTDAQEHALVAVVHPGNVVQQFAYDTWGRLIGVWLNEDDARVDLSYETPGTVTMTNGEHESTRYQFDSIGQLRRVQTDTGQDWLYRLDHNRQLIGITDAMGNAHTFSYDERGNLVGYVDPGGHSASFDYNRPFNRRTRFTDQEGGWQTEDYDRRGNRIVNNFSDGTYEGFTYDATHQLGTWTNRRGQTVQYDFDKAGRLNSKVLPDGTQYTYAYDDRGRLQTTQDAFGTTTYAYNSLDQLTRIDSPGGQYIHYTYDAAARRSSLTDQLGFQVNYHYDSAGRLQSLTDQDDALLVQYEFDDAGRIRREVKGNGTATAIEYASGGRIASIVNTDAAGEIESLFTYRYDAAGLVTHMDSIDGGWTYEYDDRYQLIHAAFNPLDPTQSGRELSYAYDAAGNRINSVIDGVTLRYVANDLNQYEKVGTTNYEFDKDGNLITRRVGSEVWTYNYDAENRLVHVSAPDGEWQYGYDALGNRVSVTRDGVETVRIVDPAGRGNVIGEYDAAGNVQARYTHAAGLVGRVDADDARLYYSFDAMGNTAAVSDASGAAVDAYAYLPFGEFLIDREITEANPYRFAGRYGVEHDGNGLYFVRQRYYDPAIGRFGSTDPIGLASGSINTYNYALNSPLNLVDINGARPEPPGPYQEGFDFDQWADHIAQQQAENRRPEPHFEIPAPPRPDDAIIIGTIIGGTAAVAIPGHATIIGGVIFLPPVGPVLVAGIGIGLIIWGASGLSADPNELTGPGFGDEGYVAEESPLAYRIDFENYKTATAPAQRVDIVNPLDPRFDLDSFELGNFGFGDLTVSVPNGLDHYETIVPYQSGGEALDVHVVAGLRREKGEVYASFQSLDPDSGLPPSAIHGFLHPENGTGRGMGHMNYVIRMKPNLPDGTQIRSVARITFDFGETIATNQIDPLDPTKGTDPAKEALVTLETGVPASQVAPLPASGPSPVTVTWSGTDDASGIGFYDVYVSQDGTPFEPWIVGTTETSAAFEGSSGSTYRFFSIATDNVTHREPPPDTYDAIYTVRTTSWHNTAIPEDVNGDGIVTPLDVLFLVNLLNQQGSSWLDRERPDGEPFYDTTSDGVVSPQDALRIINHLNLFAAEGEIRSDLQVCLPEAPRSVRLGASLESGSVDLALLSTDYWWMLPEEDDIP